MSQETLVHVSTPTRAYEVHVGRGILHSVGDITRDVCGGEKCVVVSDSNVAPLYADRVLASVAKAGFQPTLVTFPAGERNKRLPTIADMLEQVADAGLTRDDVVVAVGGGVTGDMGGFVAATYLRGIRVVQVPTSLLAMVDSSVGGKTGVDLSFGKNLVGAFHQPSAVIADVDTLATLTPELFCDSCGEVIKHGLLADPELLADLTAAPLNAPGTTPERIAAVVARNVQIKRDVVNADETERGLRQTLNLGHTIGHAIEAASDYSLGHGTCVAMGLACVARGAEAMGLVPPEVTRAVTDCVLAHGMPIDTALDHDVIVDYATHDKKRHGNGVNVVIPTAVGHSEVVPMSLDDFARLVDLGCGVTLG